ncbi:class II aldolase/adducin family protein [Pusillimonas caeni]|uniref:class II aldolase/adducin family protein n=1 Tax=Pusillimonas caeni TaxID=1348472 RepID=UPI000E59CEFC|nr:class II aldolase/adducin family protein [Pusillimonas caeni]TFL14873.1 class II aldolase/adducin family protein [Pusillimonas caeni]
MENTEQFTGMSQVERQMRVDLAACYRLAALYGMSDLIATHISARLPDEDGREVFLINPYGMLFDEITASSLVKIDSEGNALSATEHPVNWAGFVIHSTIHAARPDVACVMHTHTRAGVAVSAQPRGLLPISQQSTLILNSLAYHDYEGLAVHDDERARLRNDLGDAEWFMLRNHGLLTVGPTIAHAFWSMYIFETACQIQLSAQAGGELLEIDPQVLAGVEAALEKMGTAHPALLAWPALLRRLDRLLPGYRD